jgi:hypothetical protein
MRLTSRVAAAAAAAAGWSVVARPRIGVRLHPRRAARSQSISSLMDSGCEARDYTWLTDALDQFKVARRVLSNRWGAGRAMRSRSRSRRRRRRRRPALRSRCCQPQGLQLPLPLLPLLPLTARRCPPPRSYVFAYFFFGNELYKEVRAPAGDGSYPGPALALCPALA